MSAAILDRARAFDMIAAHLSAERRAEIAEAIGAKLLAEVGGTKPTPPAVPSPRSVPDPAVVESDHSEVARFLADHGYERKALVDATLRLTRWLTEHQGKYTREAGMRVWLSQQKGAS